VRCLIALVWLVGWLSVAAGARADMQLGMESDEALKHDPAGYLARADGAGATWMRLTVGSSRWLTESDAYVNAAAAAQADGKRVLVTLMSWQQYPTPAAWAAFARQVVARMAPYVDAWSPLNEPNHWAMAPAQTVTCRLDASARTSTSEVRDGVRIERRWHRAPSGRWERIVEETHGKRPNVVVSFRRAAGGGWAPGPLRHISLLRPATIRVRTEWERHRCRAQADGVEYRELWDAVAPILAQDADSRLVVGDLAPAPLDTVFMQAFYSRGAPDTEPEVLGIHPYDFGDPTRTYDDGSFALGSLAPAKRFAGRWGLGLWATEWGYHPEQPAQWWTAGLRLLSGSVGLTVIYDTPAGPGGHWDTFMRPAAYRRVAAFMGRPAEVAGAPADEASASGSMG
jgi:hypothetical protein